MKNLNEKVIKAIEDLGWIVEEYDEEYMLEKSSPAGEDIAEYIRKGEDVVQQVWDIYNSFDEDEHVEMWLQAKQHGTAGVPSSRELVNDAEEIRQMYYLLAIAVVAAVEESDKKKIEFVVGYHEWQLIVDGNHIHSFDDFSEDIKEDMTAEQVDDLVDDLIYGWQMSFENDCDSLDEGEECPITPIWETHNEQLREVMRTAICNYYGVDK